MKVVISGLKKAAKCVWARARTRLGLGLGYGRGRVAEILDEEANGRYPVKITESKKQLNVKKANLKVPKPFNPPNP
eukprot:1332348-Amorphochlora_amoeboformis.AAC.1